ncbi:MAG TPA: HAD-IB family hydrolase [Actinomycetota bacterium]|nr:HAD-IB family hydrolase [Actinomycetota bacterium]
MSPRKPTRAAFFDLDKTLIPGSSLFLMARGMYERDVLRVRDIVRFGWGQLMFRVRGERERDMTKSRDSTLDFVAGRSSEELKGWGKEIAEEQILPRVYEDLVRVIQNHQSHGDLTFLVTAAPIELADVIARALGMTAAIGTESEIDEGGFYTGRLLGPVMHGPEKAKAVAECAAEHKIDLAECSAYSDSINDLPLLESVGDPHAVNPEPELRRIARTRGWPIHELRTRRRALLIGIPAGLGGTTLLVAGLLIGMAIQRRRHAREHRGPLERVARWIRV